MGKRQDDNALPFAAKCLPVAGKEEVKAAPYWLNFPIFLSLFLCTNNVVFAC